MKNIKTIILVTICIISSLLNFHFQNKITEIKYTSAQLSELYTDLSIKQGFYILNFGLNNVMTGKTFPNVLCIDNIKEEKKLTEIGKGKSILIFRYTVTVNNCSKCHEDEIKFLQEVFDDTPESTVILCSYIFTQDNLAPQRGNNMKINIYNIPFDAFDREIEDLNKPYYFVLHPDMKVSHIFVPNNGLPEMSKQYLGGVKKYLSEDKIE